MQPAITTLNEWVKIGDNSVRTYRANGRWTLNGAVVHERGWVVCSLSGGQTASGPETGDTGKAAADRKAIEFGWSLTGGAFKARRPQEPEAQATPPDSERDVGPEVGPFGADGLITLDGRAYTQEQALKLVEGLLGALSAHDEAQAERLRAENRGLAGRVYELSARVESLTKRCDLLRTHLSAERREHAETRSTLADTRLELVKANKKVDYRSFTEGRNACVARVDALVRVRRPLLAIGPDTTSEVLKALADDLGRIEPGRIEPKP